MQELTRYTISGELGRGGMGVVYRAWDKIARQAIALKTFSRSALVVDEETWQRRELRLRAVATLEHPHLVSIIDVGCESDLLFFAMELVEGGDLGQVLFHGSPLSSEGLFAVLAPVANALDYLDSQGWVHAQLRPADILMDVDGRPHLAGCDDLAPSGLPPAAPDEMGGLLGNPGPYIAPEQLTGDVLDGRTHQYRLAVLAYLGLNGHSPFHDDSTMQSMAERIMEPFPPGIGDRLRPSVVPAIPVFQRALARRREERCASCTELIAQLRAKTEDV